MNQLYFLGNRFVKKIMKSKTKKGFIIQISRASNSYQFLVKFPTHLLKECDRDMDLGVGPKPKV
jgi:hypothetical protein